MNAIQAVRAAHKQVPENSKSARITRALELLGIERNEAIGHGLAHFDAKSVTKAVQRYLTKQGAKHEQNHDHHAKRTQG